MRKLQYKVPVDGADVFCARPLAKSTLNPFFRLQYILELKPAPHRSLDRRQTHTAFAAIRHVYQNVSFHRSHVVAALYRFVEIDINHSRDRLIRKDFAERTENLDRSGIRPDVLRP